MSTNEDRISDPSGMTEQQAPGYWPSGLREGYAEIGEVRLHYVEAGEGPLIVLLHGFPEFWYGWRQQIEPLAAAGFRVVAPDTRGYNLSSRPKASSPGGWSHSRENPGCGAVAGWGPGVLWCWACRDWRVAG